MQALGKLIYRWFCFALVAISIASAADSQTLTPKPDKGAAVYRDYCSPCHGYHLQNNGGVTFDLRRLGPQDRDRFINSVLNGKNKMPPWRGVLDLEQIEAIWIYIQTNSHP
jgi:mono/diheme cytochrome c family protein